MLAPHFEHKLFLSATPHNGYVESFTALLELLDNQRFAHGVRPDRDQLAAVMVRRLKAEVPPRWDGSPRFAQRRLEAIEVPYTDTERAVHRHLHEYTALRQANAADAAETFATEFVLKLLAGADRRGGPARPAHLPVCRLARLGKPRGVARPRLLAAAAPQSGRDRTALLPV
jgi:hypothetical protein